MKENKKISIIMGSSSDMNVMKDAVKILKQFEIEHEVTVVSAHRTPKRLFEFASKAESRGIEVIIAGAGGAAHLPGMVASISNLPVIGVPCKSRISIDGWDSILSILQMPPGIPVATVSLDGALNAGILAAQICATQRPELKQKIREYKESLESKVMDMVDEVEREYN
jgi:5-(carboxyamino)imidazole ribonucleotide mutase